MAQLRRLPPGTLPPVVLKFDASSLPVCLVTFKGEGLNETSLAIWRSFRCATRSPAFPVRACRRRSADSTARSWSTPTPTNWKRTSLSLMDVVRSLNNANLNSAGRDVQLGMLDYSIYTNSQLSTVREINNLPVKTVGQAPIRISDIGYAQDAQQIQTNLVRVDGQPSVYLPVLKQGGDTNTICGGGRHQDRGTAPVRRAERAGQQGSFRSIHFRQDRDRNSAPRRRDRPLPDVDHDPDLPWEHAGNGGRVLLDSAFRP